MSAGDPAWDPAKRLQEDTNNFHPFIFDIKALETSTYGSGAI